MIKSQSRQVMKQETHPAKKHVHRFWHSPWMLLLVSSPASSGSTLPDSRELASVLHFNSALAFEVECDVSLPLFLFWVPRNLRSQPCSALFQRRDKNTTGNLYFALLLFCYLLVLCCYIKAYTLLFIYNTRTGEESGAQGTTIPVTMLQTHSWGSEVSSKKGREKGKNLCNTSIWSIQSNYELQDVVNLLGTMAEFWGLRIFSRLYEKLLLI